MTYQNLLVENRGKVGLITLNRPDARNALSLDLRDELADALGRLEADPSVAALVITGNEKAFAAGADIKAMLGWSFIDIINSERVTAAWERLGACRKPVIAAVAGYALGAGCELAMMCDFIIAADNAKFGQPEIKLGTLPGAGGTQRLAHAVGKSKAMEMVLTGRMMDAAEAERCGLVSRIVPAAELVYEAVKTAALIAELSAPAVTMAKEAVNRAFEVPLAEGMRFERRLFHATFAIEDRKEGMQAFLEKRKPAFRNR
jgi:enoyl-CoA hydratase